MNTSTGKTFFGMTYCTVSYRVSEGNITRFIENIAGDDVADRSIPATPEHLAAFEAIESKYGRVNVECFAAAEQYFAENNAVRERR